MSNNDRVGMTSTEARLNDALADLRHADLEPIFARAVLVAAERRLGSERGAPSRIQRYEPALLVGLAGAHLLWLVLRLLSLS